jgi:hypothetical protein
MNKQETITFMNLMGTRLRHLGLSIILDYHQRFITACNKESPSERAITFQELRDLEILSGEKKKPFIGVFE